MSRYLTILEVSQKQAYIFASNKLKDNIARSEIIVKVLSPKYLSEVLKGVGYTDENNMVYSGGGHTVLEFDSLEKAVSCTRILTEKVFREYDGLVIFAKTVEYDEAKSPKDNLKELTAQLEAKKSLRKSAFHQGTYGIEKIETETYDIANDEKAFVPEGYKAATAFGDLGGSKNESNFIAVVHIDGNGMGKRVEDLYTKIGNIDWAETKKKLRLFSESIDEDFKAAFKDMNSVISDNLKDKDFFDSISIKDNYFPVRRIITAGDDICFVSEGRIGLECAKVFIKELTKADRKNKVDGNGYSACAGVALVHQKYPFYKAYELAEMLCSGAKKYGANVLDADEGKNISAIDWHVEFGELEDTVEDIRKNYKNTDGNSMVGRPYVISVTENVNADKITVEKNYDTFLKAVSRIKQKEIGYATGKLKELRSALKEGLAATRHYLMFNRMEDILIEARPGYDPIKDELMLKVLFDAIEILDTFVEIKEA